MPPIPILIGAAVIDSINPCAFGVLIFLLAYLVKTSKSKNKLLIHGLVYIFAVALTAEHNLYSICFAGTSKSPFYAHFL